MSTTSNGGTEPRTLAYVMAFNEAVRQAMEADDDVFVAGEDVGAFGGVFGTYGGLQKKFGERRVVDTPISEQAIVGLGIGAAVTGLRPIVDLMFMDFICVAMDQIVNQAAKLKYMFGGDAVLPLTITTCGGAGLSAAAQHSQSLEAHLVPHPRTQGRVPVEPVRHEGAHDRLHPRGQPHHHGEAQAVARHDRPRARGEYEIPLGVAKVARAGTDVTVVAWGRMANEALDAAATLEARASRVR
jgi:acetoin:2,6-dichlorophenolindophenol oxidoreductase subunit beta